MNTFITQTTVDGRVFAGPEILAACIEDAEDLLELCYPGQDIRIVGKLIYRECDE